MLLFYKKTMRNDTNLVPEKVEKENNIRKVRKSEERKVKNIIFENQFFYTLWKTSRLKSTFPPYRVKKHHSKLEMDTFKVMLLLSYIASLDNKPRT